MYRLHERVTIQSPPTTVGSRGQKTGDWTDLYCAEIPAQIRELQGRELELSRQYLPTATIEVVVRWHPNMTEAKRLVWGGRTLGIGHIRNPDNRKNFLILTCEELK